MLHTTNRPKGTENANTTDYFCPDRNGHSASKRHLRSLKWDNHDPRVSAPMPYSCHIGFNSGLQLCHVELDVEFVVPQPYSTLWLSQRNTTSSKAISCCCRLQQVLTCRLSLEYLIQLTKAVHKVAQEQDQPLSDLLMQQLAVLHCQQAERSRHSSNGHLLLGRFGAFTGMSDVVLFYAARDGQKQQIEGLLTTAEAHIAGESLAHHGSHGCLTSSAMSAYCGNASV